MGQSYQQNDLDRSDLGSEFFFYNFFTKNATPPPSLPSKWAGCLLLCTTFFGPGGCPIIRALFLSFPVVHLLEPTFGGLGVPTYLGTVHVNGTPLGEGGLFMGAQIGSGPKKNNSLWTP